MRLSKSIVLVLLIVLTSPLLSAIDFSKAIYYDIPESELIERYGRVPVSQLTSEDSAAIASYQFTGDTLKVLAILINWTDRPGIYSRETFDSMFFSRNVYPGGSIADYFYEVSYGNINIVGDVIDWYDAGTFTTGFDFESILPSLDATIDFSQYDGDNDGNVDAVVFVRSGTGEELSQDPSDIWSYAAVYPLGSGPGPYDGVYIPRWNTSPELYPTRDSIYPTAFGPDTLNGIRVFCHELTHNLGAIDLYDYDYKLHTPTYYTPNDQNDHPLVDWCIMGYGGYGILSLSGHNGQIPSHPCGWIKEDLGWITPIELQGTYNNLVLKNIETTTDSALYKLPISYARGEYFLLEYRNPQSTAQYDKVDSDFSVYFFLNLKYGPEPLDRGLIITHIYDSVGSWNNEGAPTYSHYKVKVEDAGYNPSMDMYSNPEGNLSDSAQWWYPYETRKAAAFSDDVVGQNEFSPTTYPSSDGYFEPTGIIVRVDSIVGERLYLYVHNPVQPDDDNDGIPDLTDNCPSIYNSDQLDANSNGIGDVCELDHVYTNCLGLTVKSTGRFGVGEYGKMESMDFSQDGDCEELYLFDGSPVISYVDGIDTVAYYDLFRNNTLNFPENGNPFISTIDSVDFEVYRSATVSTPDNKIRMVNIFYAPKGISTSCEYVIQRTMIFSGDGLTHDNIALGQFVNWNIPTLSGFDNNGNLNLTDEYVFLTGDGFTCQDNTLRAGMTTMIGMSNNGNSIDTTISPFNYFNESMPTYVDPSSDLIAQEIYSLMQDPIPHNSPELEDKFSFITFDNAATVGANDTLNYYTILTSTKGIDKSTLNESLTATLNDAKNWVVTTLVPFLAESCCNKSGDANNDDEVGISDLTFFVDYMFIPGSPGPDCFAEFDNNGDCELGISDLTFFVDYLFVPGAVSPVDCHLCK